MAVEVLVQGGLGGHSPDVVAGYCGLHEATRPGPLAQQLMFIMFIIFIMFYEFY